MHSRQHLGPLSPVLKLLLALRRRQASVTIYLERNPRPTAAVLPLPAWGRRKSNEEGSAAHVNGAQTGTEPRDEVLAGMRQMPKGEVSNLFDVRSQPC